MHRAVLFIFVFGRDFVMIIKIMPDPNENTKDAQFVRTVIVSAIFIPIIMGMLYYAYTKNQDTPAQIKKCAQKCSSQEYSGYNFLWPFLSKPQCTCLESPAQ